MTLEQYSKRTVVFLMSVLIVFAILFVSVKLFYKENETVIEESNSSLIEYKDDNTSIHVEYPRFKSDDINKIITNLIYTYVRDFKSNDKKKVLDITYELYNYKDFTNVVFHIENTLNDIKYKNIIINNKTNSIDYISSLFDKDYLYSEINELVFYKYSSDIYSQIRNENINNFTYIIDDNKIVVYFNNVEFNNIDFIPYVVLSFTSDVSYEDDNLADKYIAFTYDDGPSEYTSDLLKTLEANDSSATFFMIGNRMKLDPEVVFSIYNSNSEIGSHSYSHKDLSEINEEDIDEELNSIEVIYNDITNDTIKLLRPPYGRYNDYVLNQNYKIVLWNIDPKDWLVKDSNKIYNNVLSNACDGCVVLMHDIYPETIEATKRLIPALKDKGYKIVSVSKLMEIKNYTYDNTPIEIIK